MAYIVAVTLNENSKKDNFNSYGDAMKKWKEEPWKNIYNDNNEMVFPNEKPYPLGNRFPIGLRKNAKIEITGDTNLYVDDNLKHTVLDEMLKKGDIVENDIFFGHNIIAFKHKNQGLCYISKRFAKVV